MGRILYVSFFLSIPHVFQFIVTCLLACLRNAHAFFKNSKISLHWSIAAMMLKKQYSPLFFFIAKVLTWTNFHAIYVLHRVMSRVRWAKTICNIFKCTYLTSSFDITFRNINVGDQLLFQIFTYFQDILL